MDEHVRNNVLHIPFGITLSWKRVEICNDFDGGQYFFYRSLGGLGNGTVISQFQVVQMFLDNICGEGIIKVQPF